MAFQFPWTNLHELNLDWFLSKFKQFTDNYLGTTATVELIPTTEQPEVTVTGGTLDDDTDIVDPFTFNFKLPINTSGGGAVDSVNGKVGDVVLDKTDIGLGNVANVAQYSASNPPPYPVTSVNGMTGDVIVQGGSGNYAPAIITTASGAIAHFTDGADNIPVDDLTIDITPSFSGWTGATVTRMGKNLLSTNGLTLGTPSRTSFSNATKRTFTIGTYVTGLSVGNYYQVRTSSISVSDNSISFTTSSAAYGIAIPLVGFPVGEKITISATKTNGNVGLSFYKQDGTFISGAKSPDNRNYYTVVIPAETFYTIAVFEAQSSNVESTFTDIMIEVGTASAYEPYIIPATLNISWQSVAGTVYGGTLDVTTGVLTVTDGYIASYNGETLPGEWISDQDVYAPGTIPTIGAQVVYKLATPQTYQLTPQQMTTLLGVNNIWSDTGDTTVVYTADTKEYIQNLTQPTEDDMIANNAIASGKFFMIGNNLYKATTAIASGSQIIPGTNATPMSLADALNS